MIPTVTKARSVVANLYRNGGTPEQIAQAKVVLEVAKVHRNILDGLRDTALTPEQADCMKSLIDAAVTK